LQVLSNTNCTVARIIKKNSPKEVAQKITSILHKDHQTQFSFLEKTFQRKRKQAVPVPIKETDTKSNKRAICKPMAWKPFQEFYSKSSIVTLTRSSSQCKTKIK